jgi:hypothetical protein
MNVACLQSLAFVDKLRSPSISLSASADEHRLLLISFSDFVVELHSLSAALNLLVAN